MRFLLVAFQILSITFESTEAFANYQRLFKFEH